MITLISNYELEHTLPAHQIFKKSYHWLAAYLKGLRVTTKYLC